MGKNRNKHNRNSIAQRRTRQWLLDELGDGETVPCADCKKPLTIKTLTLDRIIPGRYGGTYARTNVRPTCKPCNVRRGSPKPQEGGV